MSVIYRYWINLGVIFIFPLYLLLPTISKVNKEERTNYYIFKFYYNN